MKTTALSITALILVSFLIFLTWNKNKEQGLSVRVINENSEAKVFIDGKAADDITVLEINLETDPTNDILTQADAGLFLGSDSLKAKWELENKHFILIKNPEFLDVKNNLEEPVIILKLKSGKITGVFGKAYLKGEKTKDLIFK